MNGLFEDVLFFSFFCFAGTPAEQLHAVFRLVDTAGFGQFADRNGTGWVDAALVNPFLDSVEVDRG